MQLHDQKNQTAIIFVVLNKAKKCPAALLSENCLQGYCNSQGI